MDGGKQPLKNYKLSIAITCMHMFTKATDLIFRTKKNFRLRQLHQRVHAEKNPWTITYEKFNVGKDKFGGRQWLLISSNNFNCIVVVSLIENTHVHRLEYTWMYSTCYVHKLTVDKSYCHLNLQSTHGCSRKWQKITADFTIATFIKTTTCQKWKHKPDWNNNKIIRKLSRFRLSLKGLWRVTIVCVSRCTAQRRGRTWPHWTVQAATGVTSACYCRDACASMCACVTPSGDRY